jgi:hypothetical protein
MRSKTSQTLRNIIPIPAKIEYHLAAGGKLGTGYIAKGLVTLQYPG